MGSCAPRRVAVRFLERPERLELSPRAWQARALAIYALAAQRSILVVKDIPVALDRIGSILRPTLHPFSEAAC